MADGIGSRDDTKRKIAQLEDKIQYLERILKSHRKYLSEGMKLYDRRRECEDDEIYVKYYSNFFYSLFFINIFVFSFSQNDEQKEASLLKIREEEEEFLQKTTPIIGQEVADAEQRLRFALEQHEDYNKFYEVARKRKRESSSSPTAPSVPPS